MATRVGSAADSLDWQRDILRESFLSFRERVAQPVLEIGALLLEVTVHDTAHMDGLWRLAEEIAAPE